MSDDERAVTVNLRVPLPTDMSQYESTNHFWDRLKYRTDPEPSKDIAVETVQEGRVLQTNNPERKILEHDRGLHTGHVLPFEERDGTERLVLVQEEYLDELQRREGQRDNPNTDLIGWCHQLLAELEGDDDD